MALPLGSQAPKPEPHNLSLLHGSPDSLSLKSHDHWLGQEGLKKRLFSL